MTTSHWITPTEAVDKEADWQDGTPALAAAMKRVWRLSGRPDPFEGDNGTWDAFATMVAAALASPEPVNEAAARMADIAQEYAERSGE